MVWHKFFGTGINFISLIVEETRDCVFHQQLYKYVYIWMNKTKNLMTPFNSIVTSISAILSSDPAGVMEADSGSVKTGLEVTSAAKYTNTDCRIL